ncbi:ANTAR domain-containing protein [Streptomyces sp. NPDC004393]|uniref:ANTAR domain-containing protein n=1 Tax=Streptomyces sp. NPDC004533 TaxID=3154278 RepID=UPI0033A2B3C5
MALSGLSGCPSLEPLSVTELARDVRRLSAENARLQRALTDDAVRNQAVGVLAVLGRVRPEDAGRALREVARRTGTGLDDLAAGVVRFARGGELPHEELGELRRVLDGCTGDSGRREQPSTAT